MKLSAEVGFLGSATWMVTSGIGLVILPSLIARANVTPDLAAVPLADPFVSRPAGVITRKFRSLSPASAAFVEMLAENLKNPARRGAQ